MSCHDKNRARVAKYDSNRRRGAEGRVIYGLSVLAAKIVSLDGSSSAQLRKGHHQDAPRADHTTAQHEVPHREHPSPEKENTPSRDQNYDCL